MKFIIIALLFLAGCVHREIYNLRAIETKQFPTSWDHEKLIVAPVMKAEDLRQRLPPPGKERRVALVIGNSAYVHVARLKNAANDAVAMMTKLRTLGFEVESAIDRDRSGTERVVRNFLHKTQGANLAMIYYAGHGFQVNGQNYLVPIDAKLEHETDLEFETLDVNRLVGSIQSSAKVGMVFLDACRDNPFQDRFKASGRAIERGLAVISVRDGDILIVYSTSPGQVAADGGGGNSPFTLALLRHIGAAGLEIQTMLKRVTYDVERQTAGRQRPWQSASLRSEIYLARIPYAP